MGPPLLLLLGAGASALLLRGANPSYMSHGPALRSSSRVHMCEKRVLFDVLCEGADVARSQPAHARNPALLHLLREAAELEHAQECAVAANNWPVHQQDVQPRTFSDGDFVTHRLPPPAALAGPDAAWLHDASCIYQTREPIMSEEEISTLKLEAGAAMASGTTSNFTYTQRHNLGEVHTAELPRAKAWLTRRLADTLFPMLAGIGTV